MSLTPSLRPPEGSYAPKKPSPGSGIEIPQQDIKMQKPNNKEIEDALPETSFSLGDLGGSGWGLVAGGVKTSGASFGVSFFFKGFWVKDQGTEGVP